jgi:hypothetical protein
MRSHEPSGNGVHSRTNLHREFFADLQRRFCKSHLSMHKQRNVKSLLQGALDKGMLEI